MSGLAFWVKKEHHFATEIQLQDDALFNLAKIRSLLMFSSGPVLSAQPELPAQ